MSLIQLRYSDHALQMALHLPDGVTLVAAGTERLSVSSAGLADVLVLIVDMPDAPPGAARADLVYTHSGHRDPVELTDIRWYALDGSEVNTASEAPAP